MKRKLVVLGGSLFVNLPTKFVKENSLEKGQDVDIEIEGERLIILPGASDSIEKSFKVDIKNFPRTGGRYIVAAYRIGFDKLIIDFSNPNYINQIPIELGENTIGFEIIKQEPNSCTVKNLSQSNEEDLNEIVKRIWFLLLDMGKDMAEAFKKNDVEVLKNIYSREKNINKFTNYSLRLLLENKLLDQKTSHIIYYFIRYFENFSDDLENLANRALEQKISPLFIETFEKSIMLLQKFYNLYYTFTIEKSEELILETEKLYNKIKNQKDPCFMELYNLLKKIKRLNSVIIELNILKR